MIYGENKVRHILKNTLSTKKTKRFRQYDSNKQTRLSIKNVLYKINSEDDWLDNVDDIRYDGKIKKIKLINGRRDSCKIRPFLRWAEKASNGIPSHKRLGYVKTLIKPRNPIIITALVILKYKDGFGGDLYSTKSYFSNTKKPVFKMNDLVNILNKIVEDPPAHRVLNYIIKQSFLKTTTWFKLERFTRYTDDERPISSCEFIQVNKFGKPLLLLGKHNINEFILNYKKAQPLYINGDGIHAIMKVPHDYSYKKLYNPDFWPQHTLIRIKVFLEEYKINNGNIKNLERLKDNFLFGRISRYGHATHDYDTLKYNWHW